MRGTRVGAVLVAAVFALGASACGGDEAAVEEAIEQASNGEVDVEIGENGDIQVSTSDGSASVGGSTQVPDDFPSTIPLPDDLDLVGVFSDDAGWYLTYEAGDLSSDDCESLLASYVDAGLTEDSRFESSGDVTGIFSDGTYDVTVGCTPSIQTVAVIVQDNTAG